MIILTHAPFTSIPKQLDLKLYFDEPLLDVRPMVILAIADLSNFSREDISATWGEIRTLSNKNILNYGETMKIYSGCKDVFKKKKIILKPHHIFLLIAISQAELVQWIVLNKNIKLTTTETIIYASSYADQIRAIEWLMNKYREYKKQVTAAKKRIHKKYDKPRQYVEEQYLRRQHEWKNRSVASLALYKEIQKLKIGELTETNATRTIAGWIKAITSAR